MPSRVEAAERARGSASSTSRPARTGLPVVAGNVGGALDAVVDGETGLLVDPRSPEAVADALIELLHDRERARRMGTRRLGARPVALVGADRCRCRGSARLRCPRDEGPLRQSHVAGERSRAVAARADRAGPRDAEVVLACPPGDLTERARALGITTVDLSLPGLGFSSNVLSAAVRIARAGLHVRMLARREGADVVHAASPRAGLLVACCLLTPPRRVVDVRDVLPPGAKAAAVRWTLRLTADLIVFNSSFTRRRFGPTRPARAAVSVSAGRRRAAARASAAIA